VKPGHADDVPGKLYAPLAGLFRAPSVCLYGRTYGHPQKTCRLTATRV